LRVQSVPTVYAFKDGRPFDAFTGALPESQIRTFVEKLTAGVEAPPSIPELVAFANQALTEGDLHTAAEIFHQVLGEEPDNTAALGGRIRTLLAANELAVAKKYLAEVPPKLVNHTDIAAARSALELAESSQAVGPLDALKKKAADNPKDPQAQFDLALGLYAAGEAEEAVDVLLDLFLYHKTWNENAAKTQLLQIFEALGNEDPVTLYGRRRLSSLIFS